MGYDWRKSTYSAAGNCVEVAKNENVIVVRESDDPNRMIFTTPENFAAFVQGAKAGEFDDLVA